MNSITRDTGGFDKRVWESVIDTVAGGGALDTTGYSPSDGVIPAGLPVGYKDGTTGLHPIITHSSGTLSAAVLGYTKVATKLITGGNNPVAIVLEGVLRKDAMATGYANNSTAIANLRSGAPKVTIL